MTATPIKCHPLGDNGKALDAWCVPGTDYIRFGTSGYAECVAEMERRAAQDVTWVTVPGGVPVRTDLSETE